MSNKAKTLIIRYPPAKTGNSFAIPESVNFIEDHAFEDCDNITSVTIPSSVLTIGDNAFSNSDSLSSITIPRSVTNIGRKNAYFSFNDCPRLTSINVDTNNNVYSSINGVLFNKEKTLLICYPPAKTGNSFAIPESVNFIEDHAFAYCASLTSVTIPNSVLTIGTQTFMYCTSLSSITIPNSVINIGSQAFHACTSLLSITISTSVGNIDYWVFSGCSSIKLVKLSRYTKVEKGAFPQSAIITYSD
jgi:hypothetical protein